MSIPNIFRYATSELSQDAFISWLVACGGEAEGRLREAGQAFVEALFKSDGCQVLLHGHSTTTRHAGDGRVTGTVSRPETQYQHIDVYFRAQVDGKKVSFLIEDKTHTRMHGSQLADYVASVTGDCTPEDMTKPVYFKTGYVFPDERQEAERHGYSVFEACAMKSFLEPFAGVNEIIRQYHERLDEELTSRADALGDWSMDKDFVQWEFMTRLRQRLDPENRTMPPARDRSRGGAPWTQYPNYKRRGSLYWRLDPETALRLMVNPWELDGFDELKWDDWSARFEDVRKREGLVGATFRRTRRRLGQLVNEGTVGAISLNGLKADSDGFLDRVARVHQGFLAIIGRSTLEREAAEQSDHQ